MTIGQGMAQELEHELVSTRKALERVPEEKYDWTPHPKSMTMGTLANHLAETLSWVAPTVAADEWDMAPVDGPAYESPKTTTTADLLALFDRNAQEALEALKTVDDAELMKIWHLKRAGQTLMSFPKIVVMRGFVLNHMIHHRAQLSVYLRLNDIPVPSMFGPSADEGSM